MSHRDRVVTPRDRRTALRIGFQVWGQYVSWGDLMDTGSDIDSLGFDSLWSNDHLLPVIGGGDDLIEAESGPVWDAWMTLMGWAARTTHVSLGEEELIKAGIPSNMIRVSVGLEDPADVIADVERALAAI